MKKKSISRTHSADAANAFIRYLLCEVSEALGGFNDKDYEKTIKFFGNCCAYTGVKLTEKTRSLDHLIPQNRIHCGLHLYGNIVPAANSVNKSKGAKSYEEFLLSDSAALIGISNERRRENVERLRRFQEQSGYMEKVKNINDLSSFAEMKYQAIQDLAIESFKELEDLVVNDEIICSLAVIAKKQEELIEIEKVKSRTLKWFKNPTQFNSRILLTFLKATMENNSIRLSVLKELCSDISSFDSNFNQMKTIAPQNHGKVFEQIADEVVLWEPVREYILNEYKNANWFC